MLQGVKLATMADNRGFQLGTIGALSLSVVSSVSIVICNKALMSTLGFNFGEFELKFYLFLLVSRFQFAVFCGYFGIYGDLTLLVFSSEMERVQVFLFTIYSSAVPVIAFQVI